MQVNKSIISVPLDNGQNAIITLVPESSNPKALNEISVVEAYENGEATIEIFEDFCYEYDVNGGFVLNKIDGIVTPSKLNQVTGRISPNIYVSTLSIDIMNIRNGER